MITMKPAIESQVIYAEAFFEEAKLFQRENGFAQWDENYPTIEDALDDVYEQKGYVFLDGVTPVGYARIDFDGEPQYDKIEGSWHTDGPYAVIHRMAFGDVGRSRGISGDAFALIKNLCLQNGVHVIRIDTHEDNQIMRHVLEREGFQYCGQVWIVDGPKRAYDLEF